MTRRDRAAVDLDLAMDGLLEDEPQPASMETAELLATARLLHDVLPRYHPRFGFEEHLARRLAAAGGGMARTRLEGVSDAALDGQACTPAAPTSITPADRAGVAARRRRGLLAGGAIASGVSLAIPLAGAALVAWRRGRAASGGL